jgi:formylglycine-generating enzyme required for sulfatase activity
MILVYLPAGQFEMGSLDGNEDAAPVHTVSVSGFWLDSTEVTQEMYAWFLNESGNQVEGGANWLNVSEPFVWIQEQNGVWQVRPEMKKQPIVGVSWYGATAYCTWAGRQLPTEAQWEYAAKSSNGFRFPWGNDGLDCEHAQFAGCGRSPVEVDHLPLGANAFGIYGLAGNVAEWLQDRYAADYYARSPSADPAGPSYGYYRVIRGGFWDSTYIALQTSHRAWAGADMNDSSIGFRCALNP